MKATLTFSSNSDLFKKVPVCTKLELIRDELQEIFNAEVRAHIMNYSPGLEDMLCEVIQLMSEYIDYEPSDEEMGYGSEPPITAAEIHSAAWEQKQELRR